MNNDEAVRVNQSQMFKEKDMHEALKYVQHVLIALENTPTENIPTSGHRQRLALRKLSDKQRIFGFIEDILLKVSAGKAITASNNSEMVIKLQEALEYYLQAGHKEDRRIASVKAKEALTATKSGGMEWLPIKTAKCDGAPVDLLLNGNGRVPDCYFDYYTKEWLMCGTDVPVLRRDDPMNEITHWMPLPASPPITRSDDGGVK